MLKKLRKPLALVLTVLLLLQPINVFAIEQDPSEIKASKAATSNSGFVLDLDWSSSEFKDGEQYELVEDINTSNAVKLRINYSNKKVSEEGYKPGELIITVKGIGSVNRAGKIEAQVGADKQGSGTKERDWTYTWNKASDTYTFVNNNEIKPNSVLSGYFDMVWNLRARDTIHGYSQNDIIAELLLPDGSSVSSDVLSFSNETKCDEYQIDIEKGTLYSSAGVEVTPTTGTAANIDDYVYIKYNLTSFLQSKSRGIKDKEEFIFNPDATEVGVGYILTYSTNNFVDLKDGTYKISLNNNKTAGEQWAVVAYPRDMYVGEPTAAAITSYGAFHEGDDKGNLDKVQLATDSIEFVMPADFDFGDDGGYTHEIKVSEYEQKVHEDKNFKNEVLKKGGHIPGSKVTDGEVISFLLGVSKEFNDSENIELADDFLYITDKNGDYRQLTSKDYNIESIDIMPTSGVENENGLPVKADKYVVKVFAVQNDAVYEANEETLVWEGLWKDAKQNISLPENTTAVGAIFYDVTEALYPNAMKELNYKNIMDQPMVSVNVSFHLDEEGLEDTKKADLNNGQVANLSFIRLWDDDGNIIPGNDDESNYFDEDINIDLAQKDLDTYGEYLDREKGAVTFYGGEKSDYSSATTLSKIIFSGGKFTSDMTMSGKFNYKEDETPDKFSLYTILPENVSLDGYRIEEDIWDLVAFTGMGMTSDELAKYCEAEVIQDYKDSGRTYIAFHFDFEGKDVPQQSEIKAAFKVKIAKKHFKSATSVNVFSAILPDESVNAYTIGKYADDGAWDNANKNLVKDIDRDDNTKELLAFTRASASYTYVDSSELQMTKAVMASSVSDYVQLPVVPSAEQGSEYSYLLSVKNGNSVSKDIVVKDILETGENAQWQGTFKDIDLSEAEELGLSGTVWYSDKTDPGQVGGSDWAQEMEPSSVKAVAVDFGGSELGAGAELDIYINMIAPDRDLLKDKITENSYSVSFTMEDAVSGEETKQDDLVSNFVQVKLTAKLKTVILTKVDAEDGSVLSGAKYSLFNKETEELIAEGTTNGKGQIVFKDIPSDAEYILKETQAPAGYKVAEDAEVVFGAEDTLKITVQDERKTTSAVLTKVNVLDNHVKVYQAEYTLFTKDGEEVQKAETDINGKITFENIAWGEYYIQETKAPAGYALDETKHGFVITKENVDEVHTLSLKDDQDGTTRVQLTKYEKTVGGVQTENVLQGAVFDLVRTTGEQNAVIGTYVTDKNGEIIVEDLAYGDYAFRETRAPKGYLSTSNIEFSIMPDNKGIELKAYDQRKPGSIHVFKKDNIGNIIEGVVFELYDETKNNVLGTYTTDETGSIDIPNLEWGTYFLKEKTTKDYYQLNQDWIEAEIGAGSLNIDLTVVNETKKGDVLLIKSDEIGNVRLEGAEFTLYHADGSVASVLNEDGERVLQQDLVTDENGEIRIKGLEWGKYYFKETKAPTGYGLTEESLLFTVNSLTAGTEQTVMVSDPTESRYITITKTIKADDINFANGNPTFLFKVEGTDVNGAGSAYYRMIRFDESYVTAAVDEEGFVSQSVTVSGITAGEYTVSEEESSRYILTSAKGSDNATVNDDLTVTIDITESSEGSAEFINDTYEHGYFSDNGSIANSIKANVKLTGIKAEWTGGDVEVYSEIDRSKVKVSAIYDDGTFRELDVNDWAIGDSYAGTTFPNVNGTYSIPVVYSEGGITKTTNFEVTIFGAVKEKVIRLDVVFLDNDNIVRPGTAITPDMFEVYAVYNDLSKELLDSSTDIVISPESFPETEGLCDVVLSLSKDKFTEDVSATVTVNVKLPDPILEAGPTFKTHIPSTATSVVFTDEVAPDGTSLTDVSALKDGTVMAWLDGTTWKVSSQRLGTKVVANEDSSQMFSVNYNISSVDFTGLDTSKVTTFASLFDDTTSLTSITFGDFDTSNVTNMASMFWNCNKLTSLDVSGFDTSKVTDMSYMFSMCKGLKSLDITNFDTSKVKNMKGMFEQLNNITSLDLSNFDTSSVNYGTDYEGGFYNMFSGCSKLTSLDLSHWDTSGVVSAYGMFYNCSSLASLNLDGWDTSKMVSLTDMFRNCKSLTKLDLSHFDTSSNTTLKRTFQGCTGLVELNLSGWDTSQVTSMASLFASCSNLTKLDVNHFDNRNVTDFSSVFNGCSKLTELDLTNWDTSSATTMASMFNGCTALTTLDLGDMNTCLNMVNMFYNCKNLANLNVNFLCDGVSNTVNKADSMFFNCSSLTEIDMGDVESYGSSSNDFDNMFSGCTNLKVLDIGSFSTRYGSYTNIFANCNKLERVTVGEEFSKGSLVPVPSLEYIDGADGNWYGADDGYCYGTIPSNVKGTYVAVAPFTPEKNMLISGQLFNATVVKKSDHKNIIFTDVVAPESVTTTDLSCGQDGSVVGWLDGKNYYVSTQVEGVRVKANPDCYKMFHNSTNQYYTQSIDFSNLDTSAAKDMGYMFYGCKITSADLSSFDTSNVINMEYMFYDVGTGSLSLDLSNFDTSNVEKMTQMFRSSEVSKITFGENFKTPKVTDMSNMFVSCTYLKELDLSNWDTSNVTDMNNMFASCSSLSQLTLGDLDTAKVKNMGGMFYKCSNLSSLNLSKLNTSSVTTMKQMFDGCTKLSDIDFGKFDTSNVTNMEGMFANCESLETLDLGSFNTAKVTTMASMFNKCKGLKNLDLSNFDMYSVTTVSYMFGECLSLIELDLGNFNTSNVTNMSYMFYGCTSLESLNREGIDTSKVTTMSHMFHSCKSLSALDLRDLDTSNVKNMSYMFIHCTSLSRLNLSGWDTSNVADMSYMFYNCDGFVDLNLKDLDTLNVIDMDYMFYDCSRLEKLDIGSFYTPNVEDINNMFCNCSSLTELDLSSFDTESVEYRVYCFLYCNNLSKIKVGSGYNFGLPGDDGRLSNPSPNYIPHADGYWYDLETGSRYKVSNLPNNKEATYVAVNPKNEYLLKGSEFNSLIPEGVKHIDFTREQVPSGVDYVDVSESQNGSILAWLEGDTWRVSPQGGNYMFRANKDCSKMFSMCSELESIYFGSLIVEAKDMSFMFAGCSSLAEIDLSGFNGRPLKSTRGMFMGCSSLVNIDLTAFAHCRLTDSSSMFKGCSSLVEVDLLQVNNGSDIKDASSMFEGCTSLTSLDMGIFYFGEETKVDNMLKGCIKLEMLNIENSSSDNFDGGKANLPAPDPEYIDGADGYWYRDYDGYRFNSSEVKGSFYNGVYFAVAPDIRYTLRTGPTLNSYIPNEATKVVFTDKVAPEGLEWGTDIRDLSLKGVKGIAGWLEGTTYYISTQTEGRKVISDVKSCSGLFKNKENLVSIDFYNLDTFNATGMESMFEGCISLTEVKNLANLTTIKVTNMGSMFKGCRKLTELDLSSFNTSKCSSMDEFLKGCNKLSHVSLGSRFEFKGNAVLPGIAWKNVDTGEEYLVENIPNNVEATYEKITEGYSYYLFNIDELREHIVNATSVVFTDDVAPEGLELIDVSKVGDDSVVLWVENDTEVFISTQTEGQKVIAPVGMDNAFSDCDDLVSVDLSKLDTSNVVYMSEMFAYCGNLTSINLEGVDTSNVLDMSWMFSDCDKLMELDLSMFDTSNVLTMECMFSDCLELYTLDVSSFNTSKAVDMSRMFNMCTALTELDLSGFDTSNATSMYGMFWDCNSLTTLDLSSFDTSKVQYMNSIFSGCSNLFEIDVTGFDTSNATNLSGMFANCSNLVEIGVSGFDTSNVVDMYAMFAGCENLTKLDISNFDMSNVNDAEEMFDGCYSLAELKLGEGFYNNWYLGLPSPDKEYITGATGYWYNKDTKAEYESYSLPSNVAATYIAVPDWLGDTLMRGSDFNSTIPQDVSSIVFTDTQAPEGIEVIDVSAIGDGTIVSWVDEDVYYVSTQRGGVKVRAGSSLSYIFNGKSNLLSIDFSNLDTSGTFDMESMFDSCKSLTNLDLSGFDTSNVVSMYAMFRYCSNLTNLDISSFDTSNVTNMESMFGYCESLTNLDLSSFDTRNADVDYMFRNCYRLVEFTVGDKFVFSSDLKLPEPSTEYISGATGYWYNKDTKAEYEYNNIPSNTAATYVAYPFWLENMLIEGEDFNDIISKDVTSIIFTDEVAPEGVETQDVSALGDGSIVSWIDGDTCYVSTQRDGVKVKANVNSSYMFANRETLVNIDLSNLDTSEVMDMSSMFYYCNNLSELDLSGFNTFNVITMHGMFWDCQSLTSLDVSSFDTSNVQYMNWMFAYCWSLEEIIWSDTFVTSNVVDMYSMFNNCQSLQSLDLSKFDTSNVIYMSHMFHDCQSLVSLDLSRFDTSNVEYMNWMFAYCTSLEEITWSDTFVTNNVVDMYSMFDSCESLASIDLSNFDTGNVEYMDMMFQYCLSLSELDVTGFDTSRVVSMYAMFAGSEKLTKLDLSSFDTVSNETYMGWMFAECFSLDEIKLGDKFSFNRDEEGSCYLPYSYWYNIETDEQYYKTGIPSGVEATYKRVTDTEGFEYYLTEGWMIRDTIPWDITSVVFTDIAAPEGSELSDLSMNEDNSVVGWLNGDTYYISSQKEGQKVVAGGGSLAYMFDGKESLTSIDFSNLDTSKAVDMFRMFNMCTALTELDLSGFDTSNATSMYGMFWDCNSLTTLDLSSFDTSKVQYMNWMFAYCMALEEITWSDTFVTNNVVDMYSMFNNCQSLEALDLSNFDTGNVKYMNMMFQDCYNLSNILFPVVGEPQNTVLIDSDLEFEENNTVVPIEVTGVSASNLIGQEYTVTWDGVEYTGTFEYFDPGFADFGNLVDFGMEDNGYPFYGCYEDGAGFFFTDMTGSDAISHTVKLEASIVDRALDTSNVENMERMFSGCESLSTLDLSGFDTSNVVSMSNMFVDCESLHSLDLSGFSAEKLEDMGGMFFNCTNLKVFDLRSFDITSEVNTYSAFYNCNSGVIGYAKTDTAADILNASKNKPDTWFFVTPDRVVEVDIDNQCSDLVDVIVPEITVAGVSEIKLVSLDSSKTVSSFKVNGEQKTGGKFVVPEGGGTFVITDVVLVDAKVVIESEHNPYPNSLNTTTNGIQGKVYGEAEFEGATSLTVVLDVQTESTNYDWVYLYNANGAIVNNKKYGGSTRTTYTITVPGDYVKFVMRTDGSVNNYYGFKATVTPNY